MIKPLIAAVSAALLALHASAPAAAKEAAAKDAAEQVHEMGRGLNVLGYDPLWKDPAQARFQPRHFTAIHDGGFQTVRINLQAFAHMDGDHRLDPAWLATLDRMVKSALDAGLTVILDEHDFNLCGEDAAACEPRLTAFWRQIGEHYRHAPDRVLFEILNEPHQQLDDAAWNRLLRLELAEIRRTNPERNLVIGPASWNSEDHLDALKLPDDDRHIIVTFHYYQPMEFTHQGAAWVPQFAKLSGVHWGDAAERARLASNFDRVAAWSRTHDRPILLGEFGAYDAGDMASRVAYTDAVARAAEAHGFAWCYWQFDANFLAWDMKRDGWVAPIHDALVPPAAAR